MSGMSLESRELRAFAPALVLLAICALINYVDRGNLSIAAPLLKDELRISATQLGVLLSAFFWTYTAMQFVSGWMVESFDANRVIAAGFLLWSLTTAATGLVRGFTTLLAMRLMLGVGESVMIPACSKILGFHLPEHHRGFANGVLQGAWSFGPAVGTLGAGLLMAKYGWRPVFIGIGLISLAWLPAWTKWMPRGGAVVRSLHRLLVSLIFCGGGHFGVFAQATFPSTTWHISCSLGFRFISCANVIFPSHPWPRSPVGTTRLKVYRPSRRVGFQISSSAGAIRRLWCVSPRWLSDTPSPGLRSQFVH
jgi:MFS family permease